MSRPLCLILLFLPLASMLHSGVTVYPYPEEAPKSERYRVFINDREVFVYQNPIASIVIFEMDGPVEVRIESQTIIRHVDVRPLSHEIQSQWGGKAAAFTLDQPRKLSIEFNGLLDDPLFLFAHAPIARPANNPKGRLLTFEAGKVHELGLVELQSGDLVFLEGGAIIKGDFLAEEVEDVVIQGPGIIDATLTTEPSPDTVYTNRVISLFRSHNIRLEDFLISNAGKWQVVPDQSTQVTIDGIQIVSDNGTDDGIDIVRSQEVIVRNVFVHTKDDCIAIKAFTPDRLLRPSQNILIENGTFWNTQWGNGFEIGFELRTDSVRNIVLRNCDFIHVEKGAVLSIHNADYAVVENVVFEDIRVEDARQKLLDFAILWTKFSEDGPKTEAEWERRYQHGGVWDNVMDFSEAEREAITQNRGTIQNIIVRNLRIVDGGLPFSIFSGFDEDHLVQDILIEDVYLYDQKLTTAEDLKLYTKFTEGVTIR